VSQMEYKKADDIRLMAENVITEEEFEHIDVKEIEFVRINKNIKRDQHIVLGRCIALGELTKFLSGRKYVIEFPPAFDDIDTDKEKRMVVHHELLHIPKDGNNLQSHDIEEFRIIFDKYPKRMYELIGNIEEKLKLKRELEKKEKEIAKIKDGVEKDEQEESD
jgi:predicted metallopeptidase